MPGGKELINRLFRASGLSSFFLRAVRKPNGRAASRLHSVVCRQTASRTKARGTYRSGAHCPYRLQGDTQCYAPTEKRGAPWTSSETPAEQSREPPPAGPQQFLGTGVSLNSHSRAQAPGSGTSGPPDGLTASL